MNQNQDPFAPIQDGGPAILAKNDDQQDVGMNLSKSQKKRLLFSCLLSLCVGNMMIMNVAAFLPPYVIDRNVQMHKNEDGGWAAGSTELDENDISLIIAVFSVAQIIFAPLNAKIKNTLGAKNAILLGFIFLTTTTIGLGMISALSDPQAFKWIAIILRFIQGQGDVMLQITCYTIICQVFLDDIMLYIRYLEIAVGVGLGLGPCLGSIVDSQVGYANTMYFFALCNGLNFVVCFFFIPSVFNKSDAGQEEDPEIARIKQTMDLKWYTHSKYNINWWTIFTNRHTFFSLATIFVGSFLIMFWTGFMADVFTNDYNLPPAATGYIFGAQSFTYLLACLLMPYTCEHLPRKLQFVIAIFGQSFCLLLMGPSVLLGFPANQWLVIMAFPLIGVFQVFVFIPIIPEMLERLQVDLQIVEGENEAIDGQLADKVNDTYGFVFALSNFVSPVIGGAVHSKLKRESFDLFALVCAGFGVILFVCNAGVFVFQENRTFVAKLKALEEAQSDAQKSRVVSRPMSRNFSVGYARQPVNLHDRKYSANFGGGALMQEDHLGIIAQRDEAKKQRPKSAMIQGLN